MSRGSERGTTVTDARAPPLPVPPARAAAWARASAGHSSSRARERGAGSSRSPPGKARQPSGQSLMSANTPASSPSGCRLRASRIEPTHRGVRNRLRKRTVGSWQCSPLDDLGLGYLVLPAHRPVAARPPHRRRLPPRPPRRPAVARCWARPPPHPTRAHRGRPASPRRPAAATSTSSPSPHGGGSAAVVLAVRSAGCMVCRRRAGRPRHRRDGRALAGLGGPPSGPCGTTRRRPREAGGAPEPDATCPADPRVRRANVRRVLALFARTACASAPSSGSSPSAGLTPSRRSCSRRSSTRRSRPGQPPS